MDSTLQMQTQNKYDDAKSVKRMGMGGFWLIFTLVGVIASVILSLVAGIKILTTDGKNTELNNNKVIWGILCLILLGPIAAGAFGAMAVNRLENTTAPNQQPII